MPPSRLRFCMLRRAICSGSVIGGGSGCRGRALAMPWYEGAVEEFTAAGLHPSLHDRVHAGYPHAAEDHLDAGVGEDGVEQGGELPVPVPDHEPCPAAGVFEVHGEVLGRLCYPGRGGMRGRAQDPDLPAGVLDHREHVQPRSGQGDGLEEVACQQCVGLGVQEARPGARRPLRGWWDTRIVQDLPDR
jgi:hypothetical protein